MFIKKIFKKIMGQKNLFLVLFLPLVLSGCISFQSSNNSGVGTEASYGGVFRSPDLGKSWQHITNIYTVGGQTMNFSAANIVEMDFDPLYDPAIYLATQHDGIFYTYNYGDGWFQTLQGIGTVNDVVVDPKNSCTIYAAVHNSIYKTTNCARTWDTVYFETRPNQFITELGVRADDNSIVFAGTSGGSLLKSQDGGLSWDVIRRFDDSIRTIFIQNHSDSNIMYIGLLASGIYKTYDGGNSWKNLMYLPVDESEVNEEEYKEFRATPYSYTPISLQQDFSVDDGIIYANRNGIFRMTDGEMWTQLKVLTPKATEIMYSVAVNPQNTNEVFYGTSLALYHTIDNGATWSVSKLPTTNAAKILKFSPDNKFLYLGVYSPVQ